MEKFVVTYQRMPTNFNRPSSLVVEAASEKDAQAIVKDHLRDLGPYEQFVYTTKRYAPPPAGRIVGPL